MVPEPDSVPAAFTVTGLDTYGAAASTEVPFSIRAGYKPGPCLEMEWTLDAYLPGIYGDRGDSTLAPYVKPGVDLYPRVARGGSWYDDPKDLRSAARVRSSAAWKIQDPQLPKSIWYHTDAEWLGFRLVRPLKVPPADTMHQIWNSGRGEENE